MVKKYLYVTFGLFSFVIGFVGTILPVLPTTPFLLLAGFFFARSSKKFDQWLQGTAVYKFYVADYVETKSIPRTKKWKIIVNVYVLMGVSIYFAPITLVKIILAALSVGITCVLFFVIPDKEEDIID